MPAISLIATCRQSYYGRLLRDGDEFEALSQPEADDLIAVNMARLNKKKIAAVQQPIKTRDLNAVVEAKTEEQPAAAAGNEVTPDDSVATPLNEKSTYNRRDLRAKR